MASRTDTAGNISIEGFALGTIYVREADRGSTEVVGNSYPKANVRETIYIISG